MEMYDHPRTQKEQKKPPKKKLQRQDHRSPATWTRQEKSQRTGKTVRRINKGKMLELPCCTRRTTGDLLPDTPFKDDSLNWSRKIWKKEQAKLATLNAA